ncbi:MAG: N-terminal phage integrase SAM-like domain-containing protein [Collinsella sp.]
MLFETAAEMYMADRAKRLRATTLEGYESAIRKHIAPAWTGREVESITHEELQSWVDSIELPGAADKAFKTFRQIYRWTIREYQLRIWDVAQGITSCRGTDQEKRARMTRRNCARCCAPSRGPSWRRSASPYAALGLRPSEGRGSTGRTSTGARGGRTSSAARTVKGGAVVEYACKTELSDRWLKLPRWALAAAPPTSRGNRRSGRLRGELSRSASTRASSACSCGSACGGSRCRRSGARGRPSPSRPGGARRSAVALGHTSVEMCRRAPAAEHACGGGASAGGFLGGGGAAIGVIPYPDARRSLNAQRRTSSSLAKTP